MSLSELSLLITYPGDDYKVQFSDQHFVYLRFDKNTTDRQHLKLGKTTAIHYLKLQSSTALDRPVSSRHSSEGTWGRRRSGAG